MQLTGYPKFKSDRTPNNIFAQTRAIPANQHRKLSKFETIFPMKYNAEKRCGRRRSAQITKLADGLSRSLTPG
jgi:hypothetical protein